MGTRRPTARELEAAAARMGPPRSRPAAPPGEALTMLVSRGLRLRMVALDTPIPPGFAEGPAEALARHLDQYAFRLFLRGAIQHGEGFSAEAATDYVGPARAADMARVLVELDLAIH